MNSTYLDTSSCSSTNIWSRICNPPTQNSPRAISGSRNRRCRPQPASRPEYVWKHRYYDFNVFTERRRIEKLPLHRPQSRGSWPHHRTRPLALERAIAPTPKMNPVQSTSRNDKCPEVPRWTRQPHRSNTGTLLFLGRHHARTGRSALAPRANTSTLLSRHNHQIQPHHSRQIIRIERRHLPDPARTHPALPPPAPSPPDRSHPQHPP